MTENTANSQISPTAKPLSDLSYKQMMEAIGDAGTSISSGYIDEEYNTLFNGTRAFETYDEMYRSDSTVYKTLSSAMLPIQSASRTITPYKQPDGTITPQDQEVADLIKDILLDEDAMNKPRAEFLEECLYMLRDGVSVFEVVLKINKDGRVGVRELATRLAKTIDRRETKNGQPGITQTLPQSKPWSSESSPSIPANKLLIFSYKREGNNYAWLSVLRHVAKNRIAKKNLEDFELVGFETQFRWVRKIRVPRDTNESERTLFLNSVASFRMGNDNTIVLPGTKDEFDFEFATMELPQAGDIANAIKRHEAKITDVMLGFFMKLWESEKGSYGQAKSDMDFFILGLEVIAKKICSTINRFLIKRLVDRNYGSVNGYPTLTFGELGDIDVNLLTQSIERMTSAGLLTPDLDTEQHVREMMSMPAKKEDTDTDNDEIDTPTEKKTPAPEDGADDQEDTPPEMPKKQSEKSKKSKLHECDDGCGHQSDEYSDIFNPSLLISWWLLTPALSFWEGSWYARPLTFAEEKLNIPQLTSKLDQFEKTLQTQVTGVSNTIKTMMMSKIKKAVETNNLAALADLSVPTQATKELSDAILSVRRLAREYGKDSVSAEIKQPVIGTTAEQKSYLKLESEQLATRLGDNITSAAQSAVNQEVARNGWSISTLTASAALKTVSDSIETTIVKGLGSISSISVPGTFNTWRGAMYESYTDKIYAYQYSAILDGRTTDRCKSLDGRIVLPWSVEYANYSPPQHYRCRSIRVAIMQDETFKPQITGIPSSIPSVTNINNVQPLLVPQVLTTSPAMDLLRQELAERKNKLAELEKSGQYPNRQEQHRKRIAVLEQALK